MKAQDLLDVFEKRIKHFLHLLETKPLFRAGLFAFIAAFALGYFIFRKPELKVSVKLAPVEFKNELPQDFETTAELLPAKSTDITSKNAGPNDHLLLKSGDGVKKDQILAVLNEAENREKLMTALKNFKAGLPNSRLEVQTAKERLEGSIIKAPLDGILWVPPAKKDSVLASIEDRSTPYVPLRVPDEIAKRVPNPVKVSLWTTTDPNPVEATSEIRFASFKTPENSQVDLEATLPAELSKWVHETVHVKLILNPLKNVALVDPKAVLTKDNESKILILSPFGTLHWQKVTNAPHDKDRVVVKGADPQSFRVVVPENPDLLNRAIQENVKPKVRG